MEIRWLGEVELTFNPSFYRGGYRRYMEIRWLGEVELTFNPSFLPFPCPYIHGKKTPSHFPHSGWATVKLGPMIPAIR
jgi:hypothetical protein